MAVSLTTVTGNIEFPNGATPARAGVRFRLTGSDKNGGNLFLGVSEFTVESNGSFSADVQHTDGMDERTFYEVAASYFDASTGQQANQLLGVVKVPQSETSITLASILPVPVPSNASSVYRVKRGDTISLGIQMLDQFGKPMNLAEYSVSARMRKGDGPLVAFGFAWAARAAGRFELTLSASISAGLEPGPYDFDIKFSTGVRVSRTLTGTIIIDPEVTP